MIQPRLFDLHLFSLYTTAFTPWIRTVTLVNKTRSDACFEFQNTSGFKRQATQLESSNRSERSGFRLVLRRWLVHPQNETISETTVGEHTC